MKINLDFYNELTDNTEIPEEYEEIIEKVNSVNEKFSETLDFKSNIKSILALSEIRKNILNWYDFKDNCKILEMNANYGEITGLLCKRASKVISIEKSKKLSKIIEKRHKDKKELELYVGNIESININDKFDYVIIVGIAKNLNKYVEYAKAHLEENGVILIAIDNKFGIKSWLSVEKGYRIIDNDEYTISKNKLDEILFGLNTRYYYPLPDYKMTNIIFTDRYLPDMETITRDITYKDNLLNFTETKAYKSLLQDNPKIFKQFANSFLVEASKKELKEKDIEYISYTNYRKRKYRICTIVKKTEIEKYAINNKALPHIETIKRNLETLKRLKIKTLDRYEKNTVYSKYCGEEHYEKELLNILENKGIDEFIQEIKKYKNFLIEKLEPISIQEAKEKNVFKEYGIEYNDKDIEKFTFLRKGLWDLIFQNCFYINKEYVFYDQEWFDENIPLEHIIYRTIIYFNNLDRYVDKNEVLEKLGIKENKELLEKLDLKIQDKIRDEKIWSLYSENEGTQVCDIISEIQRLQQNVKNIENRKNELEDYNENQKNKIKDLESQIKDRDNRIIDKSNELAILQSSLSWKITKPLRIIRRMGRKNKM